MQDFHWKDAVIYHIYPRSFADSNADGIGDLNGIIAHLDYLKSKKAESLAVDAIWISPFYPSPMKDGGYDITDHTAIDAKFGTLEDFDRLISEAHMRDLKVIIDYIPNHTSSEHAWFQEARSSKTNAKRDWYIWRDPKPDGSPPNNWLSVFGGPAWTLDKRTGQYYLHSFYREQPDLNWENPEVKQAMFDVVRFWLKRGVDGIRVDAFAYILKDMNLLDEPLNPAHNPERDDPYYSLLHTYSKDVAGKMSVLKELCDVIDEFGNKLIVTEAYLELEDLLYYYQVGQKETLSPFNFFIFRKPWNALAYREFLTAYERGRQPHDIGNFVLGNHDISRIATRIGRDAAKAAAVLLFSLRGIPFIYYGDELGMQDVPIPDAYIEDPKELTNPGKGLGRDPERTPMQWSTEKNAGFSTGKPWLPISRDFNEYNIEKEQKQSDSFLSLYKHLIKLRKESPALRRGVYTSLEVAESDVLAFLREEGEEQILVLINFSRKPKHVSLSYTQGIILCNSLRRDEGKTLPLSDFLVQGNDGYIIKLI